MKGTYCLTIYLNKNVNLTIGKLYNNLQFKKGYYVYVGSAMNSMNKRLERHLSNTKKMHWHIDYLLINENSKIEDILFNISNNKIECKLAKLISKNGDEIPKFGSSDCKCNSHLIYFKREIDAIATIKQAYSELNMDFKNLDYFNKLIKY